MPRGTATRWALRHGLVLLVRHTRAGTGGRAGMAAVLVDPYPLYDRVRLAGPLLQGRFGVPSASHEVAAAMLRGEAFRTGTGSGSFPPVIRRAIERTRNLRGYAAHPVAPGGGVPPTA